MLSVYNMSCFRRMYVLIRNVELTVNIEAVEMQCYRKVLPTSYPIHRTRPQRRRSTASWTKACVTGQDQSPKTEILWSHLKKQ